MKCLKCGNAYSPNGSSFCSPGHRKQYERKNKLCSYPQKLAYESKQAAQNHIETATGLHLSGIAAFYDPHCKHWHIGHSYAQSA